MDRSLDLSVLLMSKAVRCNRWIICRLMVSALWTFKVHVETTMPAHPNKHRKRAIELMEAGLATPGEISRALSLDPSLVRSWRRRAGINTENKRMVRVQRLMWNGARNDGQD
jgi:hypothetical protein